MSREDETATNPAAIAGELTSRRAQWCRECGVFRQVELQYGVIRRAGPWVEASCPDGHKTLLDSHHQPGAPIGWHLRRLAWRIWCVYAVVCWFLRGHGRESTQWALRHVVNRLCCPCNRCFFRRQRWLPRIFRYD
jgi:hypothetical protein